MLCVSRSSSSPNMTSVKRFVAPMGEWFFKTSIARAEKQKDKWCSKLTRKDWDKSPFLPPSRNPSIHPSCTHVILQIWWQAVQEGWPRLSFSSVIGIFRLCICQLSWTCRLLVFHSIFLNQHWIRMDTPISSKIMVLAACNWFWAFYL